ncbi:unnamed protein product, partial [Discosporangium mesarthrocarpum]
GGGGGGGDGWGDMEIGDDIELEGNASSNVHSKESVSSPSSLQPPPATAAAGQLGMSEAGASQSEEEVAGVDPSGEAGEPGSLEVEGFSTEEVSAKMGEGGQCR